MTKQFGFYSPISVQHVLEALLAALAYVSKNQPPKSELDVHDILVLVFEDTSKDNPDLFLSKKDDYEELREIALDLWKKWPKNVQP